MKEFYLKAESLDSLIHALGESALLCEKGCAILAAPEFSLDIIGEIRVATSNTLIDEDGLEYPEMEPVPGYHANYRGDELPEALAELEIPAPDNPVRVWA